MKFGIVAIGFVVALGTLWVFAAWESGYFLDDLSAMSSDLESEEEEPEAYGAALRRFLGEVDRGQYDPQPSGPGE